MAVSVGEVYWDASVDIMMVRNKEFAIHPVNLSPFQLLIMSKVIPDVLPHINSHPSQFLKISYPEGHDFSNSVPFVPARVTSGTPDIEWTHKARALYTIMLVDPDFLPEGNRTGDRTYVHWIHTNIQGRIKEEKSQESLKSYREYVGVAAPHGTGRHRYVFLMFEHKHSIQLQAQLFMDAWAGVNLAHVISQMQLGDPIAFAMFTSEWDDSVDLIHRSINWSPPPQFRSKSQQNRAEGIYDD